MNELEVRIKNLVDYIERFKKDEWAFVLDNDFHELTDSALVDCDGLLEFSRNFSDQINIMAPAMKEIQSLMCR